MRAQQRGGNGARYARSSIWPGPSRTPSNRLTLMPQIRPVCSLARTWSGQLAGLRPGPQTVSRSRGPRAGSSRCRRHVVLSAPALLGVRLFAAARRFARHINELPIPTASPGIGRRPLSCCRRSCTWASRTSTWGLPSCLPMSPRCWSTTSKFAGIADVEVDIELFMSDAVA